MTRTSAPAGLGERLSAKYVALLRWLWECVVDNPGTWLVRPPTTGWLRDPALVSQLPRGYRWWARYCVAWAGNPPGAELLLRSLMWLRRVTGREMTSMIEVGGLPIWLDLSDLRFLAVPGEMTAGLPRLLERFLGPGDTFLDIGANHGSFAVTAARLVGPRGLVVAIEPQARLAELVGRSLQMQDAPHRVHHVACGDEEGEVTLYVPCTTSGAARVHAGYSMAPRHRSERVRLARLDDLAPAKDLPGRVFMKVDVEGNEAACLAGARELLRARRPPILIEVNRKALAAAGSSPEALVAELRRAGYTRYQAADSGAGAGAVEHELNEQVAGSNIIALP